MKIGVLSDTHLREPDPHFCAMVEAHFRDVEKLFHLGDFVDWSIVEYLSSQKELTAVCGNMDPFDIQKAFPRKQVVELAGFKIGLIHGGGAPIGIESRIRGEFEDVHAIVYGHTHVPSHHLAKGVYFFNPGSPARSFLQRPTLGILHLGQTIEGEILKVR